MKYSIIILLLILTLIPCCNNAPDLSENSSLVPNIGDLEMSEDLVKMFSDRRRELLTKIGNGTVILRSDFGFNGGRHESRVANNFYYMTGFTEPGSAIVLSKDGSNLFKLFIRQITILESIYSGEVPDVQIIKDAIHPDTIMPFREFSKEIEEAIRTGEPVYTDFSDLYLKERLLKSVSEFKASDKLIRDAAPLINKMRVLKDTQEIGRIRKAIDITGEGFINAGRLCRPGMYEFEIEAIIEYNFIKYGSPMPAFGSIVASGANAVTLHYSSNDRKMEDGDLLLMDIGAEYGYYCADITRTIPVNGKFSKEQKDIYELVLKAQKEAIDEMIPGNYLIAGHNKSTGIITQGLYELGLITDPESTWQKKFYTIYPISHYLGMDVHDVGDYGVPFSEIRQNIANDTTIGRLLEKGMVLTVEPGLYFRSNGLSQLFELYEGEATHEEIQDFIDKVTPVYEKYKNIGIRIEDDVLITDRGNRVLSDMIPKETDEIERIMKGENN